MTHSSTAAPHRGLSFDWQLSAATAWCVAGLMLDGWAHTHLDLSGETVFTPYHAVMYGGFLAVAAVTLLTIVRRRRTAASWRDAVPQGHLATVTGIALFAVSGALDLVWHAVFGVESDFQQLLSPMHISLAAGVALIVPGPFRSVRARPRAYGWRGYAPAIVSFALLLTLVEFFTQWVMWLRIDASLDPARAFGIVRHASDVRFVQFTHDLLAMLFIGALLSGTATFLARRLPVPFGAIAVIFTAAATVLALTFAPTREAALQLVASSLAAGLAADALRTARALRHRPHARLIVIGAAVPLAYWWTYLGIVAAYGGAWWQMHSLVGAPLLSAAAGVLIATAMLPPRADSTAAEDATADRELL